MKNNLKLETTSFSLHIMAMLFMLCDHLWGTIVPGNDWLTCIGRLAFPIFAFMIVEGYFHTRNLKKYVCRLLLFAVLSEIPFNLAMGSRIFYPIHQNVLWSFLIAIGLIHWNEKAKEKQIWKRILVGIASVCIGYVVGLITFVDFYHAGILMVLVFYFFKDKKWWCYLGQLVCLWYINFEMLGGLSYEVNIFGQTHFIARQGIALLALIPIWLYKGKQGYHSKMLQYIFYTFYPLHLLILGIIKLP
ncbi:MAG: conjugal transfer protein TraX [Lachnospiraceae bacterium]|nr:conjugal transfer protein TraX [Lachnospiraceae bacterium]MBR3762129.1 conjugal transfer protein TraX [Lachnospiraceae bacterium]